MTGHVNYYDVDGTDANDTTMQSAACCVMLIAPPSKPTPGRWKVSRTTEWAAGGALMAYVKAMYSLITRSLIGTHQSLLNIKLGQSHHYSN